MKKLLFTILCLVGYTLTTQAQEPRKVVQAEPQYSDVLNVFSLLDIDVFRFDLTAFSNEKYAISLYIDEYENNQKKGRVRTNHLGENIVSLDEVPAERRDEFRKMKQIAEGENEWVRIKSLSVYLRKMTDLTTTITINVPDAMQVSNSIKNRPVGEYKRNFYKVRPFTLTEIGTGDLLTIPLLLYGSGWLYGSIIRFCGEREIDPDMKAEILTKIPHQYVLGLELKKVK